MNISPRLLSLTAVLYKSKGFDTDRVQTWGEGITLSSVYITKTIGRTNGSEGETSSDSMTLYFDVKNSSTSDDSDVDFRLGDKIVLDGREFFITTITPCYGLNGLEHYEIGLN